MLKNTQINIFVLREDITDAKTLIKKTWNEKYTKRKDLSLRHHRTKRLEELTILKGKKRAKTFPKLQRQKKPRKKNNAKRDKIESKRLDIRDN